LKIIFSILGIAQAAKARSSLFDLGVSAGHTPIAVAVCEQALLILGADLTML
jgi:hypothetical protein